jgi:hypothetical protein
MLGSSKHFLDVYGSPPIVEEVTALLRLALFERLARNRASFPIHILYTGAHIIDSRPTMISRWHTLRYNALSLWIGCALLRWPDQGSNYQGTLA